MKKKNVLSVILSAAMLMSAVPEMNVSADDNDVVYSYTNDSGTEVNITQADLDEEHWNKNALGDTPPFIYCDFPAKMTGFANDFGELYLDLEYLKNLEDMDNVHLQINTLEKNDLFYETDLETASIYSPRIEVGKQYEVILSETINSVTSEYVKIVRAEKSKETLPDFIINPSENDNEVILIADVDRLRDGIAINEDGVMEIDRSTASYDKVVANEFYSYCNALESDNIYRIYTKAEDTTYAGYVSTYNNDIEVYDLVINTYDLDDMLSMSSNDFNSNSIMSLPSGVTAADVENNAVDMGLTDASFRLRETSNSAKYRAYRLILPTKYVNGSTTGQFKVTITGTSKISAKIWRDAGTGSLTYVTQITSSNSTNTKEFLIDTSDYNICSYMDFYFMVFFTSAVEGYGMINFEPVSNFADDVTGSVYTAYTEESLVSLSNTEYTLNTASDVDAFAFAYYGTADATYKVAIKNRSLSDQALLDSGVSGVSGGGEKYLTFWYVYGSTYTCWEDNATYTIPKNTDITVYNEITDTGDNGFRMHRRLGVSSSSNDPYQLEFHKLG